MSVHTIEDLTSCILDFQANMIRVTFRKKTTPVDPDTEESHSAALASIWAHSKLAAETDSSGQLLKWRKLGFDSEDVVQEFKEVGYLGLECLVRILTAAKNDVLIVFCLQKRLVEDDPDFPKVCAESVTRACMLNSTPSDDPGATKPSRRTKVPDRQGVQ
jgi:engulfment/cell motility protein 1